MFDRPQERVLNPITLLGRPQGMGVPSSLLWLQLLSFEEKGSSFSKGKGARIGTQQSLLETIETIGVGRTFAFLGSDVGRARLTWK